MSDLDRWSVISGCWSVIGYRLLVFVNQWSVICHCWSVMSDSDTLLKTAQTGDQWLSISDRWSRCSSLNGDWWSGCWSLNGDQWSMIRLSIVERWSVIRLSIACSQEERREKKRQKGGEGEKKREKKRGGGRKKGKKGEGEEKEMAFKIELLEGRKAKIFGAPSAPFYGRPAPQRWPVRRRGQLKRKRRQLAIEWWKPHLTRCSYCGDIAF